MAKTNTAEKISSFLVNMANIIRESYGNGYDDGYDDGASDTTEHYKKAISDGLRHGSPECGREMRKLRK